LNVSDYAVSSNVIKGKTERCYTGGGVGYGPTGRAVVGPWVFFVTFFGPKPKKVNKRMKLAYAFQTADSIWHINFYKVALR